MWRSITNSNMRFANVTGRDRNGAPLALRRRLLQLRRGGANFGWQRFILKDRGMTDDSGGTGDGDASAILIPLHEARSARLDQPVRFDRRELDQILKLYGRMVAANEWRDYAIDHLTDRAVFSVFRRASEVPLFQIVKDPKLARKQGAFAVIAAGGRILKRGQELGRVLGVFDSKLRVVEA
ncbi:hypothetical protein GCM10007881_38080 [Mesorhizobium huakuii]|nr:hypothetical protein GCM10007881_38080 [Mesorhizobium huakuii]